jgi:DNA-binding Lrp family transcriptional regulator
MIDELDQKLLMELRKNSSQGYVRLAKVLGVV